MTVHKGFPSKTSLQIELSEKKDINEKVYNEINKLIDEVYSYPQDNELAWLVSVTEGWCKERAIYNALIKSIELHEGRKDLDSIPELLRKALQISFESSCGLEVFDEKNIDERIELYNRYIKKFPTGISKLDMVTNGGFEAKALSVLFGGTGVGKTISLVSLACNMARQGEDVLYITLEMAEEKITQRVEANFLDVFINDVKKIEAEKFKKSLLDIKKKSVGRILVKEFPTATINVEHIRSLLDELEIKKNFKPSVVVLDYINLMKSSRFNGDNMYSTVKSICEELRGLAVQKELCMISATQANKEGNNSKLTDLDLTNVGECLALDSVVKTESGVEKSICDVRIGDKLMGNNKVVEVKKVFDVTKKHMYKIKTKRGKEIICSIDHSFPTSEGYKKIRGTLKVGSKIKTT
jgi:replicative DNA helicase